MTQMPLPASTAKVIETRSLLVDPTVKSHVEKEHTTRCGPQGEAHYEHWKPDDHVEHKQYDEIYHKMEGQDPHDVERTLIVVVLSLSDPALSSLPLSLAVCAVQPHVSTEQKLNAVEAMEMPHTDQRCDLVNR
ncbi:hypothetical protein JCM16303_002535 [Sporobolomyces ruberrimus]